MDDLINLNYKFEFADGTEKKFSIYIEPKTYILVRTSNEKPPDWTRLENFECGHCEIDDQEFEYCPVAVHIKDLIDNFSNLPSYENVKITVESHDRTYVKETSLQQGVSGIFGLVMVTSGCPLLGKLKPLARFHLPFASLEETQIRVFAFYLLAQYIKSQKGSEPDWFMKKLNDVYARIKQLNVNIAKKIADVEHEDASINAVVILNNFAESVTMSLDEEDLSMIEPLLKEFIEM